MGALCGMTVTTNSANRREMEGLCEQHELEIWLPSGEEFNVGDGCVFSPSAPTCSAFAQPARCSAGSSLDLPRQQWQRTPMLGS